MKRQGRPRKHKPTIPSHIDQTRIPTGIYWDQRGAGRWFVYEQIDGKLRPVKIAGAAAKMADLYALADQRQVAGTDTLEAACLQFEGSDRFRRLKPSTQKSYIKARKNLCAVPTRDGGTFGGLQPKRITRPLFQRLIDKIAEGTTTDADGRLIPTPTKAVHCLRYLSVMVGWCANRGVFTDNIAAGLEAPAERKQFRMPSAKTMAAIIAFAKLNAHDGRGGVRGKPGTCPSYLWAAVEITYRCRLRGIEVVTLTDAEILKEGIRSNRRKGSFDNITAWTPSLRAAVEALRARRKKIWDAKCKEFHIDPSKRRLIVNVTGGELTKSGFESAWNRLVLSAIEKGVIREEDRFTFHGLKHRGITDTPGTRADKQDAGGHQDIRTTAIYDHELRIVPAAGD